MKKRNKYYTIATIGLVATLLLQAALFFAVDPYLAAVLSPFYPAGLYCLW